MVTRTFCLSPVYSYSRTNKSLKINLKINDLFERDACSKCVTASQQRLERAWVCLEEFNYHPGQLMRLLHSVYVTDTLTSFSAIPALQINARINSFLLIYSASSYVAVNIWKHQFNFPTKILS